MIHDETVPYSFYKNAHVNYYRWFSKIWGQPVVAAGTVAKGKNTITVSYKADTKCILKGTH